MFKKRQDGTRQIHLRVPEGVHRELKVRAARGDQTINEMLVARITMTIGQPEDTREKKP